MDKKLHRLGLALLLSTATTAGFCAVIAYDRRQEKTQVEKRIDALEADVATLKRRLSAKDEALDLAANYIKTQLKEP